MFSLIIASEFLNITEDLNLPPPPPQQPLLKPLKPPPSLLLLLHTSSRPLVDTSLQNTPSYSAEHPFHSEIVSARWLTGGSRECFKRGVKEACSAEVESWGEDRHVFQITLSIQGAGIVYSPGDSIGILAPNPVDAVNSVLQLLQTVHIDLHLDLTSLIDSSCLPPGYSRPGESFVTLGEILHYRVDLVGPMRKLSLAPLCEYCDDIADKSKLQWLLSKGEVGKKLWTQFIEKQGLGIMELLTCVLPSCRPPLYILLACAGTMRPRYYSISCSPLVHPHSVSVALSLERFTCSLAGRLADTITSTNSSTNISTNKNNSGNDCSSSSRSNVNSHSNDKAVDDGTGGGTVPAILRTGLCTGYLLQRASRWLAPDKDVNIENEQSTGALENITEGNNCSGAHLIRIFHKQTLTFHLPAV